MTDVDELLGKNNRDSVVEELADSDTKVVARRKSLAVDQKTDDVSTKRHSAVLIPLCRIGDQVGLLFTKRSSALRYVFNYNFVNVCLMLNHDSEHMLVRSVSLAEEATDSKHP